MNNILVTSAGRRVSLVRAFQKELIKIIPDGKVFACDFKPDLSSACMIADDYFNVPRVTDTNYCRNLSEICIKHGVKVIIPTIDTELFVLAKNKKFFLDNNIIPLISDPDIIAVCRDKRLTHNYFDSIGIRRCRDMDPRSEDFPFFAKPVDGSSSIGVKLIRNKSDITPDIIENERMMFVEYLSPADHKEITIDLYFDRNSCLRCAVPRERIEVRAGEVNKSVTRRDELYDFFCEKFKSCQGFTGCITLQVFKNINSGEVIGIEINPRFGGGYPLSYHAGANFPEMIIREYILNEEISFSDSWTKNLLMLRYDDEIIVHDYKG